MNKQEFIEDLAGRCDFSKAEAGRALEAVLDSITEALQEGDEVALTGFGRFLTQDRKGREGVNPRDPTQTIKIAAATVPKFRASAALRETVANASVATTGSDDRSRRRTTAAERERPSDQSSRNEQPSDSGARDAEETAGPAAGDWKPLSAR